MLFSGIYWFLVIKVMVMKKFIILLDKLYFIEYKIIFFLVIFEVMLIGLCFVGYFGKLLECWRLCGGVLEIRMYIFVVFVYYDKWRML